MVAALISEDFAGLHSQVCGLAERAGLDWTFYPVHFREKDLWNRLPISLWSNPLAHIAPIRLAPATRLIISAGGRGGAVGMALGQRYGLPVVQIQHPRRSLEAFALVVANIHDRISGPNVITVRTALHHVTDELLAQARQQWQERLKPSSTPLLAVLLGGANGRFRFGENEAEEVADSLEAFLQKNPMRCVLTSSRRTSPDALRRLKQRLESCSACFLTGQGVENPYLGLLACADVLAVTTDSVSMISEAVATTAPVGIIPLKGRSSRIGHFIKTLEESGRVQPFGQDMSLVACEKVDDTIFAAREMANRLKLRV